MDFKKGLWLIILIGQSFFVYKKFIQTIPIFTLDKWKKQVYTVSADSIKEELDYTNFKEKAQLACVVYTCLLYTSPSPRD